MVVWQWGQKDHEEGLDIQNWLIDNAQNVHDGNTAVHPPNLVAATPVNLTIDCSQIEHTELSFFAMRLASSDQVRLDLFVDGTFRQTINNRWNSEWGQFIFDVPKGKHTYSFQATSSVDSSTSFILDSFACKNTTPTISSNGIVDFDRGYIPPETKGNWFVDNAVSNYSDGGTKFEEAAIHPPPLQANTLIEMSFDCGQMEHTELSFFAIRFASIDQVRLDLFVDGTFRQTINNRWNSEWDQFIFDVPKGKHTYSFRASSSVDSSTSFVLDSFACKNTTPTIASNGIVDFDRGYIPPETKGDWLVDNAVSTYLDGGTKLEEAAIHPPTLQANKPVEMSFDCGQMEHAKLNFFAIRFASKDQVRLDLFVDGTFRQTINNRWNSEWDQFIFDVPKGKHTYSFRASSSVDTSTSFAIDSISCTP